MNDAKPSAAVTYDLTALLGDPLLAPAATEILWAGNEAETVAKALPAVLRPLMVVAKADYAALLSFADGHWTRRRQAGRDPRTTPLPLAGRCFGSRDGQPARPLVGRALGGPCRLGTPAAAQLRLRRAWHTRSPSNWPRLCARPWKTPVNENCKIVVSGACRPFSTWRDNGTGSAKWNRCWCRWRKPRRS